MHSPSGVVCVDDMLLSEVMHSKLVLRMIMGARMGRQLMAQVKSMFEDYLRKSHEEVSKS